MKKRVQQYAGGDNAVLNDVWFKCLSGFWRSVEILPNLGEFAFAMDQVAIHPEEFRWLVGRIITKERMCVRNRRKRLRRVTMRNRFEPDITSAFRKFCDALRILRNRGYSDTAAMLLSAFNQSPQQFVSAAKILSDTLPLRSWAMNIVENMTQSNWNESRTALLAGNSLFALGFQNSISAENDAHPDAYQERRRRARRLRKESMVKQ